MKYIVPLLLTAAAILVSCDNNHLAHDLFGRPDPNTGEVVPKAQPESFESIFKNILEPKCVRCHGGDHPAHGVILTNYATVMSATMFPPLVVPGRPEQSNLYNMVLSGQMPKNSPRLSESEIRAIYSWIFEGARETNRSPAQPVPSPAEPGDIQ